MSRRTSTAPTFVPQSSRGPSGRNWLWVHLGTLVLAVPVLVWVNRDQGFSGDEWVVITPRGLGSNPQRDSILAPHFEHWTTLPILAFKGIYGLVAMRSYWPYVALLILVQLVATHMLWRVLLRVGVVAPFATAVAALFVVMAVGWENLSTAWQITIISPLAFGFGALLLMPQRGERFGRRDVGVWVLLTIGVMCSGTGVTMAMVVGIATLLRRGWKLALMAVSVPALVWGAWYLGWGTEGQRNESSLGDAITGLPGFVWRGMTDAVGGLFRIDVLGPVVLIAIVAWIVWRARPRVEPWPLVIALSAGALLGSALTGLRRAGTDGGASRYAYVVVALLLPALALALQDLVGPYIRRHGRAAVYAVTGVLVACLVVQVVALNDEISNEIFVGQMRPRTLATALLLREGQPVIAPTLFPIITEPRPSTVKRLDAAGELPSLDEVTHDDVLSAAEWVQMTIDGPGSVKYPVPGALCTTVTKPTDLALAQASSLTVTSDRTGLFDLQFRDDQGAGDTRQVYVLRKAPEVLNIARAPVTVRIAPVPGGSMSVCGIIPAN
ncbi:MAG: hypothetical protein U0W40_17370 [Acidimicrobiia bacterium]